MEEKIVQINDIEVHYKITGEGQPILILHGWGSRSDRWTHLGLLLAQQSFSLVIPDLPGFGKSSIPPKPWGVEDYCAFVEDLVQKVGLKEFSLLGHSFAGGVAAVYATLFPQRVKKLILVAPSIIRKKTTRKTIFKSVSAVLRLFSFVPFYPLFRRAFYKYIVRKSDYPHTSGMMKETYLRVVGKDLSSYLPSIQTPTLIIWGGRDDVLPVQDAYIIQSKIQNSQLVIIPQGNHDMEQHMPELLAQKILEFLKHQ